ncbi:hypothetical protein R1flu_025501 [Riccia fluitans]|uniref:Uncharacterized protein n=1 Tax=Riccia fluitans TaxID=41844 RepID=A0ABD1XXZ0_9MARC
MGKSIRSKRKKRLRTLKREIVEPHYDAKDAAKLAVAAAAMAAPKIELPKRKEDMEDDSSAVRGRSRDTAPSGDAPTSMAVDVEPSTTSTPSNLKAKGGISKRGKSKNGHKSKQVLKKKKKKGLKF